MSFSLKPKQQTGSSNIDWDAINEQIEEGPNPARISLIVDLGIQERGKGVSYEGKDDFTVVKTEEEAEELIEEAAEIMGDFLLEKYELDVIEEEDDGFKVPFRIYNKKDAQEVAIFADLPETRVEYVKGEGDRQYRIMLNSAFKGELAGFSLNPVPPKKQGGVWTFDAKSKLAKLAKATGHKEILEQGEHLNDIGRILGEAFLLNIEKTDKGFINAKDVMPLPKGMPASELDNGPVGITFEGATVELLEQAHLRKSVIEKIKKAKNYEGSAMQKAIEEFEAKSSSKASQSESEDDSEEQEESPKKTRRRRQKAEEKPVRKEKAPEPEEDDDDFEDDDIPF